MKAAELIPLARQEAALLRTAVRELKLSARTYARILLFARRAAEGDRADRIRPGHLLDAIQYCTLAESS